MLLLFLAPLAFPQANPPISATGFTIYGLVRLPDGSPAQRVVVKIAAQTGLDRQAFTDDSGRYEFRELPRGRYFLTASSIDDPDLVSDFAETDTGRGLVARILVNLFLRVRADKTTEKAASPVVSAREAAQQVPKQALKAFEQGIRLGTEGKLDRAEESFTHALDVFPGYFQALAERGNLRVALGRVAEASEDFRRALELDLQYGPALRGAGICNFQQGKYADAISDLDKAAAAEPHTAKTFLFLGLAHLMLDQREPARASLQRALSLDPKESARAHVHLATLFMKEDRPGEALKELDAYLAAVPNPPDREKLLAVQSRLRAAINK